MKTKLKQLTTTNIFHQFSACTANFPTPCILLMLKQYWIILEIKEDKRLLASLLFQYLISWCAMPSKNLYNIKEKKT